MPSTTSSPPSEPHPVLDPVYIVQTVAALADRVEERFPGRGLSGVARQMLAIARSTAARVTAARRPILWVRAGVGLVLALLLAVVASIAVRVARGGAGLSPGELLQVTEATTNELILLGGATLFLLTAESRIKRRRALAALRDLRALAHIIDMHQLTKDPDRWTRPATADTRSSPRRTMTRHQLARYLDYCSELLALDAKLAALYAQSFDDEVVLAAVDEVESLAADLSGKIWQKLVILNQAQM